MPKRYKYNIIISVGQLWKLWFALQEEANERQQQKFVNAWHKKQWASLVTSKKPIFVNSLEIGITQKTKHVLEWG